MKNIKVRTDLAIESDEFISDASADKYKKIRDYGDGIEVHQKEDKTNQINTTIIKIKNKEGERRLGKPQGIYITIEGEKFDNCEGNFDSPIVEELKNHIQTLLNGKKSILVVGLGNRRVTPDAIGPLVVDNVFITRHLNNNGLLKEKDCIDISGIAPGVMGQTGIETVEIIKSVVNTVNPEGVIVVDALAARDSSRLGKTIQITDTGINPGSGVGNDRAEISKKNLGTEVIAVGVPTVISAAAIVNDALDVLTGGEYENGEFIDTELEPFTTMSTMFVTPKDIDELVKKMALIISESINGMICGS